MKVICGLFDLIKGTAVTFGVFLILTLAACTLRYPSEAFTPFEKTWFNECLEAMGEPLLGAIAQGAERETYRFLWLRTFHNPIAVRVWKDPQGYFLKGIVLSGAGGYELGTVSQEVSLKLTAEQFSRAVSLMDEAGLWTMPVSEKISLAADGADWVLEAARNGQYRGLVRWSPEHRGLASYQKACLYLVELSGIIVPEKDIY